MSTLVRIRMARASDTPAIADIHARCWEEVYHFMPAQVLSARSAEYRRRQWEDWFRYRPHGEAMYVLLDKERVVGFAVAKPNHDASIDARGEFHACYILPEFRGGNAGPIAMKALARHLWAANLWPACVWAFRSNPYRRIYPQLGCIAEVFRDRVIEEHRIAEIGYRVPDYNALVTRLDLMCAAAERRRYR